MNLSWLFFSFQGRINRSIWWMVMGATLCLDLGVFLLTANWASSTFTILLGLVAFALRIAPSVKRLHDRNKPGWWAFIYFGVPMVLSVYILSALPPVDAVGMVTVDSNLANTLSLASFIMLGIVVWVIVDLGIGEGTRGDNKYGPDPLAGQRPGGIR